MHYPSRLVLGCLLVLLGATCSEPVTPTFALGDPFYLVEGSIVAGDGISEVRIQASNFREISLQFQPVTDAQVVSSEAGGAVVVWTLADAATGTYHPPTGFAPQPGQTWHFEINLNNGISVSSSPETIPAP
ncbi:MAG: hypothetical protein AAF840_15255, partial [Bacteroidota bacterium]